MIRFLLGFLIVFGVAGGLDTFPADASLSFYFWTFVMFFVGLFLMVTGVRSIQR